MDLSRLAEMLSAAFCVALTGQLDELREAAMTKLALRVTVDSDKVDTWFIKMISLQYPLLKT